MIERFNQPVPRYTSYPTAPEWGELGAETYEQKLAEVGARPISLYFHIPFCRTMCLYCACSVVLNRKSEKEERYVDVLMKEIDLVQQKLGRRAKVKQLHFGGGTPTQLTEELLTRLMNKINEAFDVDGEVSIEIDPRTVVEDEGRKLRHLRALGFNRVSFGVQDTNEQVQEAVRRRQSLEVTVRTYEMARQLGFDEINVDLIYGLPYQTVDTFAQTATDILRMRPNRIALYSYAKVPWLKAHQKAIKDETLPATQEKLAIYQASRERFIAGGYVPIGMDHFGLPHDSLTKALHEKKLLRNFQGYSLHLADDLIGLGTTATGFVSNAYVQNCKDLDTYYKAIEAGELPTFRGKVLSEDDTIRRWVIQRIMCDFELDKQEFADRYGTPFDDYFAEEMTRIDHDLVDDGNILRPNELGKLFIRNVASTFDAYLQPTQAQFSKGV